MAGDLLKELELPGYRADLGRDLPDELTLMVLGGRAPSADWLRSFSSRASSVWAIDRGVEVCIEAGLAPKILLGDRDSSSGRAWRRAEQMGAEVSMHKRDKDLTDFQLAMDKFKRERRSRQGLVLTGAFGGRLDHMWSLLITALAAGPEVRPICMADENESLFFTDGGTATFEFEHKPDYISLISFSEQCRGVNIEGVRWPLFDELLEYSFPYSVSNRPFESRVSVSLDEGLLGVYFVFNDFTA